jgi:hypothetical protein
MFKLFGSKPSKKSEFEIVEDDDEQGKQSMRPLVIW